MLVEWLAIVCLGAADTRSAQELFQEATRAQLDRRYDEAQSALEKIAGAGLRNADVEFNLGTSYAESGDWGRAILHLRRADLLRPGSDIAGNLQAMRERILEKHPGRVRESSLWIDIADNVVRWPLELITGGAWLLLSLALLVAFFPRRPAPAWTKAFVAIAATAVALTTTVLVARLHFHDELPPAVVMKPARALAGPDERFKTIADLVAGDEVRLRSKTTTPGFTAIELNNGVEAWVLDGQVAAVKDWTK